MSAVPNTVAPAANKYQDFLADDRRPKRDSTSNGISWGNSANQGRANESRAEAPQNRARPSQMTQRAEEYPRGGARTSLDGARGVGNDMRMQKGSIASNRQAQMQSSGTVSSLLAWGGPRPE